MCQDPCLSPNCTATSVPAPFPSFSSAPYYARQYWIGIGNVKQIETTFHWSAAGHLGCTLERLNKTPVTQFLFDETFGASSPLGSLTNPSNPHRIPNFRSADAGGGLFVYADGSVAFVADTIDLSLDRRF